jgi:hypothetical protein
LLAPLLLFLQSVDVGVLRSGAGTFTLEQARRQEAASLGDALLSDPHPKIVESIVHPAGMEAAAPWVTEIELLSQPELDQRSGFCSAFRYSLKFEPTIPQVIGKPIPSPAAPRSMTVEKVYRFPGNSPTRPTSCSAPFGDFFGLSAAGNMRELDIARLLRVAKQTAEQRRKLPFKVTFDDQIGSPEADWPRTAMEALAQLPLGRISYIDLKPNDAALFLPRRARVNRAGQPLQIVQVEAVEGWVIDIAFDQDRPVRMHIVRRIPPPF